MQGKKICRNGKNLFQPLPFFNNIPPFTNQLSVPKHYGIDILHIYTLFLNITLLPQLQVIEVTYPTVTIVS